MKMLIALLLILSPFACADYLYVGAWSQHMNEYSSFEETPEDQIEYNESHNLIAYERNGYMLGHFKNSFNQSTIIAAKNFEAKHGDYSFFLALGATRGYTDCANRDEGTSPKVCAHYQAGFSYTKHRIQPVFSISGAVALLTFRIDI